MTVSQISVFTESKPGHLARNLRLFEDGGINVRGYSVSDTGEYGIARFIVDDPMGASDALRRSGSAFTITEVICARLLDNPGELARVMEVLSEVGVNVTYSYSMISTYIIIATDNPEAAKSALGAASVDLIDQDDLSKIVAEKFA